MSEEALLIEEAQHDVAEPIDGYDPLDEHLSASKMHLTWIQESTRRVVQNILKSYTGYFDVFNEAIQNALDAIDLKARQGTLGYKPRIHIYVDIPRRRLRVVDNGVGMDAEQFKLCFRPNTSFKNRRESRGHKGVGATFLAYGFSMITLHTKRGDRRISAALRGGRDWAEERTTVRPKLEVVPFDCPDLDHETSGTCIEILIAESQRPKLSWLLAKNADVWYDVLRIKTPLGGVYLTKEEREELVEPEITISVIGTDHSESCVTRSSVEYYYPHEMPIFDPTKVKTVRDIEAMERSLPGNLKAKASKIPDHFQRLEAVWEIWSSDEIIKHSVFSKEFTEEQKMLLAQHQTTVYGFFISSARIWTEFQSKILQVHANARLLEGGLQIASDHMVQGDLSVIPLTSEAGYHRHAHIIVHFRDGNPDMGRKVFQPELKEVSEEIARRAVDIFKSYKDYMRGDSGAPPQKQQDRHFEWQIAQKERRDNDALVFETISGRIPLVTNPRQEQEVISLFCILLGEKILRGIELISVSQDTQYDCAFVNNYPDISFRHDAEKNPLGVSTDSIQPDSSRPQTLEFKYSLDGLVSDFDNAVKYPADIDVAVVWELGTYYKTALDLSSLLVAGAGSERRVFGATHRARKMGGGTFEVICLRDLLGFLQEPDRVLAEHRVQFGL